MITYHQGNLIDSPLQTLLCTVNVVGAMGKGLALDFKERWPDSYRSYLSFYPKNTNSPHYVYRELVYHLHTAKLSDEQQLLFFPTKSHWRMPSRLEWIEDNLEQLTESLDVLDIRSLATPLLGCGHGQLNVRDVLPMMQHYLDPLPIPVHLYLPLGVSHE